ncbi:c6 zinc finger domain protein [Diplodia corticola]|uniref:C6 zinc finger domain protein n=1 Tax=Diplodia corticola TaxID=236234 RepID=A0A1J9RMJ0_9PEZI|nr:c6 zinc finger domain protein [Diplodia corticola]OJD33795.1 c6 zinc finger domain protein [Diplodia corticola]
MAERRKQQLPAQAETSSPYDTASHATERERTNTVDEIEPVPLRERIFNNVRATYAAPESPSCLLQLYYGPSSNFSFLQHIHSHLTARRASRSISDGNDDDQGIDRFKYKSIVFGSASKKGPATSPVFLHYELALSFLQNFLSTTHHYLPLLDSDRLYETFEKLYGRKGRGDSIEPLDKAGVIVSMALGAMSTEEEYWRQRLLTQARTESESVRYHVNVKAVQVALLMAHCEFATGHPNLAYLSLGSAVTKAFAAGLHKGGSGSDKPELSHTMWNLFCNESISCLMLGRPYLLDRDIITVPLPQRPSFMAALVRLCTTIRNTHRLYFHHETSTIANMVESAHEIRRELEDFSSCIKQDVGVCIGELTCLVDGEKLAWHVVTNYLYFYTMILAFRPLLLLQVELQRPKIAEEQLNGETVPNTSHHRWPLLLDARERCINAARSIISFSESLLSTVTGIQSLCNHGYFLESACFVLVLAATHDSDAAAWSSHIQFITRGLASLRKLVQREPIPSVVAALERMRAKLVAGHALLEQSATPEPVPLQQGDAADVHSGPAATMQMEDVAMMPGLLPDQQSGVPQGGGGIWTDANQEMLASAADDNGILENFELPNMDWGIDFSLLDVEEFVSVMGIQPAFNNFH